MSAEDPRAQPRYAIYFAPRHGSPWWAFGAGWLGRDEVTGQMLDPPQLPDVPAAALRDATQEPRRYGFHATLKPPFRLREGTGETMLLERVGALAAHLRAVPLGALDVQRIAGFLALVPAQHNAAVHALAARCVLELDDLRAPATPQEVARRRPEALDPVERELLAQYGYPYVLGRYRFHMTLTGTLDDALAERLRPHARAAVDRLQAREMPVLDRVCVFRQPHADAPFLRIHDQVLVP